MSRYSSDDPAERIKNQAWEISKLLEVVKRKNLELDALHFVWCSGACESGVHRFTGEPLTQEIVDEAVSNTERLVTKWRWLKSRRAVVGDLVVEGKGEE